MYQIIIVDDHLLFAEGLSAMLQQSQFEVTRLFTDTEGILAHFQNKATDIVFLDINLENNNGLDLCKLWLKEFPFLKIIALSMHHEYRFVSGMYNAGAKGYLLKNSSRQEILEAIKIVADGGVYYKGEVANILASKTFTNEEVELNPKERKILLGVLEGKTSRQIANEMIISIKTVEFYRNNLLAKFNVRNSIELVNKTRELFFS